AALLRLETALALVEGWVQEVSGKAVAAHLPQAGALQEMLSRRRATGGPAEQTFASLVGLELRPRRLREAAALWAALDRERGQTERDDLWSHPDLMPTAEELDDPSGFVAGRAQARAAEEDVDAALSAMLDGTLGGGQEADTDTTPSEEDGGDRQSDADDDADPGRPQDRG